MGLVPEKPLEIYDAGFIYKAYALLSLNQQYHSTEKKQMNNKPAMSKSSLADLETLSKYQKILLVIFITMQ